jgi:ATP-binding cassette subfamily C (CFTR/MRP) protein 4
VQTSGINFSKLLQLPEYKIIEPDVEKNNLTTEDLDAETCTYSSNESISSSVDEMKVNSVLEKPFEKPEIRSSGRISKTVYLSYLSAGGSYSKVILLILMYFFAQFLNIGASYWISIWYYIKIN